ncbi:MAG TPA: class I SAM-dependent methyltransferase [Vicinamibacterales bacterium]|nr:class I SAM-dependent methyltransferase [Vicinamibacterales bacterium]
MMRVVIGLFLLALGTTYTGAADLKVGTTYAGAVVVPTFRSAAQQKPASNPRLFNPQDLGLLEPPDREAWQKPDQVMDALRIAEGTTVADIGAGGGWFTIRLARRVGKSGKVFAVDVQRLMMEAIERRVQREELHWVTAVQGDYDDPRLPADARTDAVLIVDAFHEMEDPVLMLKNVARTLKPQGRIGIIDYREGDGGPGPDAAERVPPSVVISQAAAAGLKLVEQHTFLRYQYFLIFGK